MVVTCRRKGFPQIFHRRARVHLYASWPLLVTLLVLVAFADFVLSKIPQHHLRLVHDFVTSLRAFSGSCFQVTVPLCNPVIGFRAAQKLQEQALQEMDAVGRQSVLSLPSSSVSVVYTGGKNGRFGGGQGTTCIYNSMKGFSSRDDLRFNLTTFRHLASPSRCAATGERRGIGELAGKHHQDYYEILGVEIDASAADIRKAYRQLQKKYHPDIAGLQGHAMTLLLNEAYSTLMDGIRRAAYDSAHSYKTVMRESGHTSYSGVAYSTWNGPDRPQGIFVDENSCVGCRECVFMAGNTFTIDEALGSARVRTQWGDPESRVKMAIDVCPVNCIHYVEREDLPVLEYLIRPQPRESNGVFGGGWDRPANVFMAARAFQRRMKDKIGAAQQGSTVEETPAQQKARQDADFKIRAGAFWRFWSWGATASNKEKTNKSEGTKASWKNIFGRASTSELLSIPVQEEDVAKVVANVQDWALTFASSSELPLPMPFRADPLTNGVQLNLVTLESGVLSSIGALVITVEQTPCSEATASEGDAVVEYMLHARRQGVTGSKRLPGEGRILQLLKEALTGQSGYSSYRIRRP